MLVASAQQVVGVRRKRKEGILRTKETKVSRVNDGFGIFLASQVVQRRETTPDISDAEYSAMDRVN